MVLELQKQQNTPLVSGSTPVVPAEGANTVTVTVPVGQGAEVGANEDTLSAVNSSNTQTTKRSVEELYNSISAICTQYGISLADAKKVGLLSSASGLSEEYLLNADQSEINKIIEHIKTTIAALQEDGLEVNITNLEKYSRLYNIQVKNGWDSVASFREANKRSNEGLTARLKRMYGIDVTKLSTQEKAEILEAYFSRYFSDDEKAKVKNAKTPEEAEQIKEQVRTKQITDYTKLLFNSSPEEYELFRDAIDYLAANKRYAGFDAIMRSCDTPAQRTEIANPITYEQRKAWGTSADQFGDRMSVEENKMLAAGVLEYKDAQHIEEYHEAATTDALEFYTEENNKKLEEIKAKLEKGETLTEEEQEILAQDTHFRGDNAGQMIGVGNNKVVDENTKEALLQTINSDAYEIGEKAGNDFYREVINEVVKYVEDHPETLTMSKDDFVKLMDKVTDNNYSKVVNDIAKGTTTELTAPQAQTEKAQSAPAVEVKGSLGVAQKEAPADLNAPANQVTQLYSAPAQETKTETVNTSKSSPAVDFVTTVREGGVEAFYSMVSENGTVSSLADALNNKGLIGNNIINAAKNLYKTFTDKQDDILAKLSMKGIGLVSELTAQSTWEKVQDKTFGSFGATKLIKENAEKALEENA